MANSPFSPQELKDGVGTFERGVNHGLAVELVPRNQLADALNTTLRGNFVRPRPYFQKIALNYINPAIKPAANAATVQGACTYHPDSGPGCLMLSGSGKLYQFQINGNTAIVTDVTGGNSQDAAATQSWLWQAEKWVIWNDGTHPPVFYDGATTRRSNYGAKLNFSSWNTATITIPAPGTTFNITFNDATNVVPGDIITVKNHGQVQVLDISATPIISVVSLNLTPVGFVIPIHPQNPNDNLFWFHIGEELPPGRIGTYGKGRIWMSLTDGKQFIAGDIEGGSSGTQAENYRDAILNITENLYLAGGGAFSVPGTLGAITAMRFATTLDASLGQGPLQVFTRSTVFSCNAPVNRLEWQDITNPILTESLRAAGATGQDSTQNFNGDIIMRSVVGLTSLILARREFSTWGNTPISREVAPTFAYDSQDLLPWASSIDFDNRYLTTAGTVLGPHGPYFNKIVPINADPVSTLAGKAPSIYDARYWTGLNIYKLLVDEFDGVTRAFAFVWNDSTDELELYEILMDYDEQPMLTPMVYDNGTQPVTLSFETGVLDCGMNDPKTRPLQKLMGGEIWVDKLIGQVDFQVFWKPDEWPCWLPWHQWTECNIRSNDNNPGFRPRMGFGEPPSTFFDKANNRNLRLAFMWQLRVVITGHVEVKGLNIVAVTEAQPQLAPPAVSKLCPM
jgi:hypothetical protein